MSAAAVKGRGLDRARLRAWLEYVAQAAIDWLDELDAAGADLEDDELGDEAAAWLSRPRS